MLHPSFRPRGSTLVAAVVFIAIISGATGIAFMATSHLGRNAQRTRQYEGALAVGDANLEWAFAQWRSICRTQSNVAMPGSNFSTITSPTASWLPQPTGYSVSNYNIVAVDVQGNPLAASATP